MRINAKKYKVYQSPSSDEQVYNAGLLSEVEVSALKDKSYNKLSDSQKQVYDSFVTPGGTAQTVNIGEDREMHWKNALQMVKDVDVNISNTPEKNIFGYDKQKVYTEGSNKGYFRPHAQRIAKKIHVPAHQVYKDQMARWQEDAKKRGPEYPQYSDTDVENVARKNYFSNIIAETAHIPEFYRKESFKNLPISAARRLYRSITGGSDKMGNRSNYEDPHDIEYHTHTGPDSFEEKLRSKYEIKQKGGFKQKYQTGGSLPKAQDGEEPLYGGLLPEVEVSALTDKTYNTLSNPQKQVYDTFVNPDGSIAQTVNIGQGNNTAWNDYETEMGRTMHWKGALQMTEDVGVKNISNKPYENTYPIENEKGDFRAHSRMGDRDIYIPPYNATNSRHGWMDRHMKKKQEDGVMSYDVKQMLKSSNVTPEERRATLDRFLSAPNLEEELMVYEKAFRDANPGEGRKTYFDNLIAEYAHLPEYDNKSFLNRPITKIKRAYRGIKEGKYPDNSNYTDPHDFEYKTHTGPNSYEEKLRSKYEL